MWISTHLSTLSAEMEREKPKQILLIDALKQYECSWGESIGAIFHLCRVASKLPNQLPSAHVSYTNGNYNESLSRLIKHLLSLNEMGVVITLLERPDMPQFIIDRIIESDLIEADEYPYSANATYVPNPMRVIFDGFTMNTLTPSQRPLHERFLCSKIQYEYWIANSRHPPPFNYYTRVSPEFLESQGKKDLRYRESGEGQQLAVDYYIGALGVV